MDQLSPETLDQVIGLVSEWGLQVIGAIAVLILGRMAAGMVRSGVRRALARANVDESLVPFVSGMAYYVVIAVVVIAVLNLFGIETTSLIAVLGAAGLAVGLALQGTLSNFASGVMLLLFRPFKSGDVVEIAGTVGSVQEIGIFSTILHTGDNIKIIVPNSEIYGQKISNYTANDTRRNDLVIGIGYDDDIGRAVGVIERVVKADDRVLSDPAPVIAVGDLGDSSVNLLVRPWCATADYWGLRWDLTRKIKEELESAGCSIPFPQHDVHIVSGGSAGAA